MCMYWNELAATHVRGHVVVKYAGTSRKTHRAMGHGTSSHRPHGGRWASMLTIRDDVQALGEVYDRLRTSRQRGFHGARPLIEDAKRVVEQLRDAPWEEVAPLLAMDRLDTTLRLLDVASAHTGREHAYYWHNAALEALHALLKRKGSLKPYTPPPLSDVLGQRPSAIIYRLATLLAQGKLYHDSEHHDIVSSLEALRDGYADKKIRDFAEASLLRIRDNPADIRVEKMVSTLLALLGTRV